MRIGCTTSIHHALQARSAPAVQQRAQVFAQRRAIEAEAARVVVVVLDDDEQIRGFDWTTMRLIEPLRALRMIHFSAWIARRWQDTAFKAAFPDFGTEHYWQEQIEALALQLEKVQYLAPPHA